MSAIVPTPVQAGGIDLTKLTDAEQWLIFIFAYNGGVLKRDSSADGTGNSNYWYQAMYTIGQQSLANETLFEYAYQMDWSNISTVSLNLSGLWSKTNASDSALSVYIRVCPFDRANYNLNGPGKLHSNPQNSSYKAFDKTWEFGEGTTSPSSTSWSDTYTLDVSSYFYADRKVTRNVGYIQVWFATHNQSGYVRNKWGNTQVEITAFKTKDGKTHTPANWNY